MLSRVVSICLLLALGCLSLLLNAQQTGTISAGTEAIPMEPPENFPRGMVVPFSDGGVIFEPLNPTENPAMAHTMMLMAAQNPDYDRGALFSGFLSNSSGKKIVGMTSVWKWVASAGVPRRYVTRIDLLLDPPAAIFRGEFSKLVYGPGPLWLRGEEPPAYSINKLFGLITVENKEVKPDLEDFRESSPVSYELDAVILEDGTVLGPDRSETLRFLTARQKAIEAVSKATLELLDRQKDPTELLTSYAQKEASLDDPVTFWSARIARVFLGATNQRAIAAQLSTSQDINLHQN